MDLKILIEAIESWSNDETSPAQSAALNLLAFVEIELKGLSSIFEQVQTPEIDIYPEAAADNKRNEAEPTSEEDINSVGFTAYPNPTTGEISFHTMGVAGQILIYDLRGKVIAQLSTNDDQVIALFDTSMLAPGLYIATFTDASYQLQTVRFVKQ